MHAASPMWRNGRRNGLKIRWAVIGPCRFESGHRQFRWKTWTVESSHHYLEIESRKSSKACRSSSMIDVPRDALADRMRKLEISETDLGGNLCAVKRPRRSECKQSFNRGDAAASSDRHQRHRPGFAFASCKSQARAGTIARSNRKRSRRAAHG